MSDKRIPLAAIRRAWLDPDLTAHEAAAQIGLSRVHLQRRVKALGLPRRKDGRPLPALPPEFEAMWRAGVSGADLARLIGRARSCVTRTARLRGLPLRRPGFQSITLAAWRVAQLDRGHWRGTLSDAGNREDAHAQG